MADTRPVTIDTGGPTWAAVTRRIDERIADLRDALEQDTDPAVTAKIRGRIAELRHFVENTEQAGDTRDTEDPPPDGPLYG